MTQLLVPIVIKYTYKFIRVKFKKKNLHTYFYINVYVNYIYTNTIFTITYISVVHINHDKFIIFILSLNVFIVMVILFFFFL